MFNGLGPNLSNLSRLSDAITRSISPENFTGEKGKGGMALEGAHDECTRNLGQGWKISPRVDIPAGMEFVVADIEGPGAIHHIWMTIGGSLSLFSRFMILRIYWEDSAFPSVEVPVGDFFASPYGVFGQISSLPVCLNPRNGFNCYWEMPFRKRCKITMHNISEEKIKFLYQIDYTLTEVPDDYAYFHAQFRRVNPLPYKQVYTIVDNIRGNGQYVGTALAWGVNNNGWWGEGEIKFFLDGDAEFPTICGTGTEDYFCGAYDFMVNGRYVEFSSPYSGMPSVIRPDGALISQQRFALYRWHIADPIRFQTNLKVTIQALGWRSGGRRLPLQDDIASVAFWYQDRPAENFPPLPDRDYLEIL